MNSITRTAKILKLLAEHPRRFTDIVKDIQLTKSTVHRLLVALDQAELIKKNPLSGCYHIGPLISQLAANPINEHQFLIVCSIEEMRKLRDLSRETVTLQISMGTERICLEEIQSMESIKYVSGKGSIYPIFVGSAGKMLLSMFGDDQIDILMRKFNFDPSAPNPIKTSEELWKEIELARNLGHSTSFGERVAGSASVAVPITDYICPAILNVLGPIDRFTKDSISGIIEEMKDSAARIYRELSHL
ncbi:IclR family transcriptional regulator [Desulfococcaceae bacterium HSG9]|nr:IclR family transcriptional regulator [Desulfococcaceae bacterium HSG9]